MKYTVEYGKTNCSGWGCEGFNDEEEARARFDEIVSLIQNGSFYATTAILSKTVSDGISVSVDFYSIEA